MFECECECVCEWFMCVVMDDYKDEDVDDIKDEDDNDDSDNLTVIAQL